MFRKSTTSPQINLFSSTARMLSGKSQKHYEDDFGWHNQFFEQVTARIDESIFAVLYSSTKGSPNASIRILVAMMILKEGQGYSDAKLFEDCQFNLLTRKALGLVNIDDALPVESTYYLFRKQVADYAKSTGQNLFDQLFTQLSKAQCLELSISGKRIRMDSKLLGSNIAWVSRYELVHSSLANCYVQHQELFDKELLLALEEVVGEKAEKVVYRYSSEELKERLKKLGSLVDQVLVRLRGQTDEDTYHLLSEVFAQQFEVLSDEQVIARDPQTISAQSIQSPYDPDAHYRNKAGQQVKGYSANVTESCDDDSKPNLIAEVSLKAASAPDTDFLQSGVEKAAEVFSEPTAAIHADGAYHSTDNQQFCDENHIDLHLHAIQGREGRYRLEVNAEGTDIERIIDNSTSEEIPFKRVVSKKGEQKWRIKETSSYRYFTQKDLNTALIRKQIAHTPKEVLQKRNNVEATIFQLGYHCSGGKTKYRGLVKHQMWADMRCLWINFVRIANYLGKPDGGRTSNALQNVVGKTVTFVFSASWSFYRRSRLIFRQIIMKNTIQVCIN